MGLVGPARCPLSVRWIGTMTTVTGSVGLGNARRADRLAAQAVLWEESSRKPVRLCGRSVVSGANAVAVRSTMVDGQRHAGFAGVATCGSVWACPVCSARVAAARQAEIAAGIAAWRSAGRSLGLVTLTMRHNAGQSLRELWDGLSYAWKAATTGRTWKRRRADYGVAGVVRVVEATHGKSGWHVHVHALVFFDVDGRLEERSVDERVCGLGSEMFQSWRDALRRSGLAAPIASRGGLDARPCGQDADPLSAYFTKHVYKAAAEVTRADRKRGRGGNRTPFDILRSVYETGDAADLDLWHEWEAGSAGRRQLVWSKGLRETLGLLGERTDQELAEEQLSDARDDLVLIPVDQWARVRATPGLRAALLAAAEDADSPALMVKAVLSAHGIGWEEPPGRR